MVFNIIGVFIFSNILIKMLVKRISFQHFKILNQLKFIIFIKKINFMKKIIFLILIIFTHVQKIMMIHLRLLNPEWEILH